MERIYRCDYPYNYGSLAAAVKLFLADAISRERLAEVLRETENRLQFDLPSARRDVGGKQ